MRRLLFLLILFTPALVLAGSEMITVKATPQEVPTKVVEAAQYLSATGKNGLKEFQKPAGKFVWKDAHL